ncbi:MAG: hypothetical protein EAZ91_21680 [Cytophagales bacterium]|nr:MAG: hypothetical protein EAZ91_21680 [Cytophagales bacterium]
MIPFSSVSQAQVHSNFINPTVQFPPVLTPMMHVPSPPAIHFQLPYNQLSTLTYDLNTGEALSRVPLYAVARLGFDADALSPDLSGSDREVLMNFTLSYPLGTLNSDHAGYASFDLTVLRGQAVMQAVQARLQHQFPQTWRNLAENQLPQSLQLNELLVLPFADAAYAFDAMKEAETGPNFLFMRMDFDQGMLAGRQFGRGGASMQNPSILDWRLSPGSFSMSGSLLIGEDGTETLLPANLATQRFRFRQVVRHVSNDGQGQFPNGIRFGYVVEYSAEWFPIGHSLGQILYSLPLAPGEKVKIAVVDWARSDNASRAEKTGFVEQLQHQQVRDRSLTEAVQVALREWQSGSSFMAGGSQATSGGGQIGPFSVGVGNVFSLGGASSSSEGTRDVSADTAQRISDSFQQATTAMRELKSTVILQSEQAEKSNVQTRVVVNYNRGHAQTILYYEVLRHYRVITRTETVRPALIIPQGIQPADALKNIDSILSLRFLLEAVLLDPRLNSAFDALLRIKAGDKRHARAMAKFNALAKPANPADIMFSRVALTFVTGEDATIEPAFVDIYLKDNTSLVHKVNDGGQDFDTGERTHVNNLNVPIKWGNLRGFGVHLEDENSGSDWDLVHFKVVGITNEGVTQLLLDVPVGQSIDDARGNTGEFPAIQAPPPPARPEAPDRTEFVTAEDEVASDMLLHHLATNADYYSRILRLNGSADSRVSFLNGQTIGGRPVLDLVENKALETLGDGVVYAVTPAAESFLSGLFNAELVEPSSQLTFTEQLATLPTRGVFGEIKLSHNLATELLDTEHNYDWSKSVIPDNGPEITGVDAGSRAQKPEGLAPSPFPNNIVNVVSPQALPDPTGLSGAFGLMSAMGPFRDMSGMNQLGPFLQNLSNNATQLAAEAQKGASKKALIDSIRTSKELTPAEKTELIKAALTGAVQQANAPATPPAGATQAPAAGGGAAQPPATGTGGTPGPNTPAPAQPNGGPPPGTPSTPAPKPKGPVQLQRTASKTRLLNFVFMYDTGKPMVGNYHITLMALNTNEERAGGVAFDPNAISGSTNTGSIVRVTIPESFGEKSDIRITITGEITSPVQFKKNSKIEAWSQPIETIEVFARAEFKATETYKVSQPTQDNEITVSYSKNAQDQISNATASKKGITVTVSNAVKGKVEVPLLAEAEDTVTLGAAGTYEVTDTDTVTRTEGDTKTITVKHFLKSIKDGAQPTIKAAK